MQETQERPGLLSGDFHLLSAGVTRRLEEISRHELFVAEATDPFASYLAAFPEGTNPLFRTRTEHDCSCCKNFIRNLGCVVAVVDGKKESVWRVEGLPPPYNVVAKAMDDLVTQLPIAGVFRTKEATYGSRPTPDSKMIGHRWDHLFGTVPARCRSAMPDRDRGAINTTAQVFKRGLEELRPEALEAVLDLIDANSLYRGAEFRAGVAEFLALQKAYRSAPQPDLYVWANLESRAARLRNTAIGTLLQELSVDHPDLEGAVRSFERMVAPTNYKRPTALITPRMVDDALKTLASLGLEQAIERRFARLSDVSVNDVLWVENDTQPEMKGGLRAALLGAATQGAPVDPKHATAITMDAFLATVVPTARSMEVLVKNRHVGNFVSLTAPIHPDTGRLLKWRNDFAWSYEGEVTDSIKARVKRAGGNTDAALRVSLSWSNYDDLDIHAECPDGHVYFANAHGDRHFFAKGSNRILDVDMNAHGPRSREPVENLSWVEPRDGEYVISVNQFNKRETDRPGFTIEAECNGEVKQFSYRLGVRERQTVPCLRFQMKGGVMSDLAVLAPELRGGDISTTQWGVATESFAPVATLMTSPNHWDAAGNIGAKHWFFVLKDCRNPNPVRGLYNEFLRGDLEPHRKVFEVLGAKTKCQPTDDQLSGLGFTAARNDEVTVKVATSTTTRAYTITF